LHILNSLESLESLGSIERWNKFFLDIRDFSGTLRTSSGTFRTFQTFQTFQTFKTQKKHNPDFIVKGFVMRKKILTLSSLIAAFVFMAGVAACGANSSPAPMPDEGKLAGNWVGESICQIKDSPCHDEKVIYHLTEPDTAGKLSIQADKIVDGKPEDMGTLDCTYRKDVHQVRCEMAQGVWEFTVSGKEMAGTLTLPDKRLYRKISVTKEG
jgi:hypothetical protein